VDGMESSNKLDYEAQGVNPGLCERHDHDDHGGHNDDDHGHGHDDDHGQGHD
jgi:hypothetical protein